MQKSSFIEVLGNYPGIRVLDFLIENDISDYSKTQIAELSGISFNTLETFWDKLIKNEILKETRKVGNAQMYQLDKENPSVKILMDVDKELMLNSIDDERRR